MPKVCYCGNDELKEYSEHYYMCEKCHTLVSKVDFSSEICNVTDEEEDLYGSNYWQKIMEDMTGQDSLDGVIDYYLKERVVYWIKYILKYLPTDSKVAEVGCGLGQLAYVMKQLGYNQVAYELSPQICEYIRNTLKINICCGEFGETKETYDAVLAFDLVEHLLQPKEFLKDVYARLTDNGLLCIQMPSYDYRLSYQEMLEQKPRFESLLTEEQHVYLYSRESITALLKQIGFQDIVFEPACFGDDYDMFLFAAKQKLNPLSVTELEKKLNDLEIGRIIKALQNLYFENKELQTKLAVSENDSILRLRNAEELEQRLEESEKDRELRLQKMQELEARLAESEKDREIRLQKMQELEQRLSESEEDRAARLEIIENCNKRMAELDENCNRANGELQIKEQQLRELETVNRELVEQMKSREENIANLQYLLDLYLEEIKKIENKKRIIKR